MLICVFVFAYAKSRFSHDLAIMVLVFNFVGIEEGVDHLANAVVICGQPQQLIQVFSQTLPPPVVQLLMLKIPVVKQVHVL